MRESELTLGSPQYYLVSQARNQKQFELRGDQPICPVKAVQWRSFSSYVHVVERSFTSAVRVSAVIVIAAQLVALSLEKDRCVRPGAVTGIAGKDEPITETACGDTAQEQLAAWWIRVPLMICSGR